ncbi:lantibiotic dehydratase family protein [Actinophytocola gossypii]|uniref:Lantibiotic dehydratase n=1 Tax=Actinophytocola gossypii TaxID=2812003 RepID=A0ABT2J249_9PSEU|nr:lantibiotic dehydratase family protein [Actinophytocola gossypii]MCT2581932.1 lantibiotic dehydratase [Actinophytocola gossypii]
MTHLVPLGDTGWSVWRDAVLRSTGFPADGLAPFTAPNCAAAADALLAGTGDEDVFGKELELALESGSAACRRISADPVFREAVSWQSPTVREALDGLLRGTRKRKKQREREQVVARYWQRYSAKNETVGFFGPAAWATVDPAAPALTVTPGPEVIAERTVELEHWTLAEYARVLVADPEVRGWLPVALAPHLTVDADGRRVLRPAHPPVTVTPAEVAALTAGPAPARDVVAALTAAGHLRAEDDGWLLVDRLVERGLLVWAAEPPQHPRADAALRALLDTVGDDDARARALAGLDRLTAARDAVADAAGDADRTTAALAHVGAEFTALTGTDPHRRAGQTYAGRGVCYLEARRDVSVVFGGRFLADLAAPLAPLLRAARWLTAELAAAYGTALADLYDELAADGAGEVSFADLWFLAQGALFGAGERPVDAVAAEFVRRWATLFGLDEHTSGPVHRTAAELTVAAEAAFPADRPGWSAGRLHSPDLQLCAAGPEAVERGDYLVVLGELHAAWPTFDCAVFTRWHPDPDRLRDALAADLGEHRVRPLYPTSWPRYSGRVAHTLDGRTDHQLGFTAAPGADPDRLLPATSVTVQRADGQLVAVGPDGRTWPLVEMFSALLAMHAVDGFKLVGAAAHTPRITVDRLVVARETWRTTLAETGLGTASGDRGRYLAVRRWRRALGLPDRVFVKLATETKPVYVDLTSPVFAGSLCAMVRSALNAGRADAVTVSEVLPDADEHWLTDADGRRYSSELRLQLLDSVEAP